MKKRKACESVGCGIPSPVGSKSGQFGLMWETGSKRRGGSQKVKMCVSPGGK